MKFTRGPWRVEEDTFGKNNAPGFNIKGSNSEGVNVIAFMWSRDAEEEQAANARLIASAPELLEALEDAQQALAHALYVTTGTVQPSTRIVLEFAEDKASEALAKAKGATK